MSSTMMTYVGTELECGDGHREQLVPNKVREQSRIDLGNIS